MGSFLKRKLREERTGRVSYIDGLTYEDKFRGYCSWRIDKECEFFTNDMVEECVDNGDTITLRAIGINKKYYKYKE